MDFLFLILGVVVLLIGGEILVKGAAAMALRFNISAAVVGMTVVAIGTSAPEMVVCIDAALDGKSDIAMGNVIGSNIANIGLILGLTAIIFPITVSKNALTLDWPVMMGASLLLFLFCLNGALGQVEGVVMVALLTAFIVYSIRKSRRNVVVDEEMEKYNASSKKPLYVLILLVIVGSVGLVLGAQWFLEGAEGLARSFGVSDRIIGVTIVAFGTSVPELATSVIAAFRKQKDISLGNIIGSNLFNILAILGVTSIIKEINISDEILSSDFFWMLGISFLILPLSLFDKRINRFDGILLLVSYIIFIYLLFF